MTSNNFNTSFIPKDNMSRTFGKQTVSVYPEIDNTMSHAEKSYAFMVTKSALEATTIRYDQKLQILASITRTGPLVGVLQSKFLAIANTEIHKVGNFSVLAYHGRNGVTMPVTLPNGHLRPTNRATAAQRREADILYAKLTCDLRFTEAGPENATAHPFTYFVRLPNEDRTVTNSTGGELQLSTFHGPDDWSRSVTDQSAMNDILESPQAYDGPFTLTPPAITDLLSAAVIQSTDLDLRQIALSASWPSITKSVFKQLCPNLDRDPIAVIQSIHQVTKDAQRQEVHQTVQQYFTSLQNMANFLPTDIDWAIDITQHFWTHLKDHVRVQMQSDRFVHNSAGSRRDPFNQLMNLQAAFAAATIAEDTLSHYQRIAKDTVQSSLTLATGVDGVWIGKSVAKDTMEKYDPDRKPRNPCWGCGSPDHSFTNRKTVTCPNKDKPGVIEKAAKAHKEFNECLAAKKKAAKSGRDRSDKSTLISQLKNLTSDQIKTLLLDNNESPTKKRCQGATGIQTFCVVFEAKEDSATIPRLPILVECNLPHISLPISHDPEMKF
jgi:hypothetical protein